MPVQDRRITFIARRTGMTTLTLVDALGKQKAVLFKGMTSAGVRYTTAVNRSNLGNGTFFSLFRCDDKQSVRRIVYVK